MSTLVQYRLPVKVFILNNQYMGMVRQWQELLHGGRYSESYSEALPDFVKLAEAFGGVGLRATQVSELDDVIRKMLAVDDRPVIAVLVDNAPGVLARVIGLFSGRGYNIESLTVAEIDAAAQLSRITVVTSGTPMVIERIKAQLARLVPVHAVRDLTTDGPHV